LKRVIRTPNRFTISIPSWPAKALFIFLGVLLFASCVDELEGIGSRKNTSRFKVYYREFDIPVTTVQTDSINTSVTASDRLLCGYVDDPIFGKITAEVYTQFAPANFSAPKVNTTNRTNFQVVDFYLQVVLSKDYYEYGDTTDASLKYTLHAITDPDFNFYKGYTAASTVLHNPTPFASGSFIYDRDSIKEHRKLNFDSNPNNDAFDTLFFRLNNDPFGIALGDELLDTATIGKGVYSFNNKNEWIFNPEKTDSVFRKQFPGFVIKPGLGNDRILGFKSEVSQTIRTTRMVLKYSYQEGANTNTGEIFYFNTFGPAFSTIVTDRTNTPLSTLNQTNTEFNAPDDYCYLQGGTGLYAKLDFRGVRSFFDATPVDTLVNVAINGAELYIETEPDVTRQHVQQPQNLTLRVVNPVDKRFKKAPLVSTTSGLRVDPRYVAAYYALGPNPFLDALDDETQPLFIPLTKKVAAIPYYSEFATNFFSRFLRPGDGFEPITEMALIPSPAFGKTLDGVSFKNDKVKLRVYFTKAL
jgi:hypothetical protein